ncbi:MAG: tetratricopeptide repeat protein, partial [Cyanobacteria bacterium P01_B01_bin.77]
MTQGFTKMPSIDLSSPSLANLIALLALLVSIGLPLLSYLYSQRRSIRTHFAVVWQLTRFLPRKKLLGDRPYYEFYLPSDADLLLETALKRRQNALVIGRPLSGKTRAVYQALCQKYWHITIPKTTDINSETFEFPRRLRLLFWLRPVVVVDDLHRFVEQQNFDVLLRAVMERGIQLIATCRSGADLQRTLNQLNAKGLEPSIYFPQQIQRQRIAEEIGQALAERLKLEWNPASFDGTVGSVLMKLGEMERRFVACSPAEKTILRSLQVLYRCGIYQENQRFPLAWVKRWSKTLELEGPDYEWTGWLERLAEKEFLKLKDGAVEAEEAYLETAVKPDVERPLLQLMESALIIFEGEPDALNRLGNRAYGEGKLDYDIRAYLDLSIKAYQQALLERTRERVPLSWAMTQNNLGTALRTLGERESGTERLEDAVDA